MKYLRYLKTRQKSWTLSPSRFTAHHMEGWSSCCPWPWQKCTKTQNKTPWISDFLPLCNFEVLKLYITMCHWNISGPFLTYEHLFIHIFILWYLYWSIETETHDSCVPQIVERLTFLWGRWILKPFTGVQLGSLWKWKEFEWYFYGDPLVAWVVFFKTTAGIDLVFIFTFGYLDLFG